MRKDKGRKRHKAVNYPHKGSRRGIDGPRGRLGLPLIHDCMASTVLMAVTRQDGAEERPQAPASFPDRRVFSTACSCCVRRRICRECNCVRSMPPTPEIEAGTAGRGKAPQENRCHLRPPARQKHSN